MRLSHDGGATWSRTAAAFALWAVDTVAPTAGPADGGTALRISGEALPPCDPALGCSCLVGNVSVNASAAVRVDAGAAVRVDPGADSAA